MNPLENKASNSLLNLNEFTLPLYRTQSNYKTKGASINKSKKMRSNDVSG